MIDKYQRFNKIISNLSINQKYHNIGNDLRFLTADRPTSKECFYIKTDKRGDEQALLKTDEILFIEALQNRIRFNFLNRPCLTSYNTLKEMEKQLILNGFARIHKSFLVNENKILFVNHKEITLCTGQILSIGITYRKLFSAKMEQVGKK